MIIAVPAAIPVTTPVDEPIVATEGVLLVHVPPPGVLESVVVFPAHIIAVPKIPVGPALTETVIVALQPPAE